MTRDPATSKFQDEQLLRRIRTRTEAGIATVTTYDAGGEPDGRHRIGYIAELDHTEIFRGDDITVPAGQAIDSDTTLAAVLDFLSLRPGDTDAEYFANYTPEQAEFADACGEELALYGDSLRTHVEQWFPPSSPRDVRSIRESRLVLERMRANAGDLARTLETLQANLATACLDLATLEDIANVLDAAATCRANADIALAGLNARHGPLEEAVTSASHPAKTEFYRHA